MASGTQNPFLERKRTIVSALCKCLSLDPNIYVADVENDVKNLIMNILKAASKDSGEFMKWISFAENFPLDSTAHFDALSQLNEDLTHVSVLVGSGLRPSEADIIVFGTIHSSVISLSDSDRKKVPHILRWMDYIQSVYDFGELFTRILLEAALFDPPRVVFYNSYLAPYYNLHQYISNGTMLAKSLAKEAKYNTKKVDQGSKDANVAAESKKNTEKKATSNNEAAAEKKKLPEKVADEKDKDSSVSLLKIQVGRIRKASKHPSADSLLVEEIDVGESKCRQVVSGLAKYCSPDDLMNRLVVLITNVKPGKLRDVVSEGLVLCASNGDHTVVEPLLVPEGARIGECVTFSGYDGKPEDVLNPKKKQLEKITPHLFTDDKGVATFKGVPFMTSGGPCTSSICKASIK